MATIGSTDFNAVSVFVSVVEAGSFTAAARLLALPKSSVSRRVKHLEDHLGVQLLQRTTRQLRLTDAGREYFERVSSALAGVEEAQAAISDLQDQPKGVVRLAASTEWGGWILAPIVALFIDRYPEIRVDLSITDRMVDLVKDGFDLALSSGPLADSSLLVRTIESLESGLFAAPAYLAKHGTPRTVADLASHAFVLRRPGPSNRLQLFGARTETVVVTGPVTTDDRSFGFEAVRAGLAIGVLPTKGCAGHSGLTHLLPEYRLAGVSTQIVYPASRHVPQRVVLFRDFLVEHLDSRGEGCAVPRRITIRAARRLRVAVSRRLAAADKIDSFKPQPRNESLRGTPQMAEPIATNRTQVQAAKRWMDDEAGMERASLSPAEYVAYRMRISAAEAEALVAAVYALDEEAE